MKKLIYLIVAIVAFGLIVAGCGIPVVPPTEQGDLNTLTKNGEPVAVWVDDGWSGNSNGDLVDGHTFGTDAFATILDGINAVAVGGTVNVAAGTYTDDIWDSTLGVPAGYRITKSVTLLGALADVDPQGETDRGNESILVRTNGVPYSLYVSGITIDGFTFTSGGGSGGGRLIIGDAADDVTIKNCIIKDISGTDPHGVYIYPGADNALVEYNTFSNTAWEAIRCEGNAVISNNTIKDILSNKGIFLGGAGGAQVIDNVITNTFHEGIYATAQATITDNEISECYKGIQVRDSASNSTVSDNAISNTAWEGIEALVTATITGNEISQCYKGILVRGNGSFISDNTISNTTWEGIQVYESAIITGNEISGGYSGIQIRDSANGCIITHNKIVDVNTRGIDVLLEITSVIIKNNIVLDSGYCGVTIWNTGDGSGFLVNYNNFEGSGIYGVEAKTADAPIDATRNWWGHASGPGGEYGRKNPAGKIIGKGDAVSDNVNWDPWLSQPTVPPTQILNKWDLEGTFVAKDSCNWDLGSPGNIWEYSIHIKEATGGEFSVGSIHFSTGGIEVTGIVEQTKNDYGYWFGNAGHPEIPNLAAAGRVEYDDVTYNFMFLLNEQAMWFALSDLSLEPYWENEEVWMSGRVYQLHSTVYLGQFDMGPKEIH